MSFPKILKLLKRCTSGHIFMPMNIISTCKQELKYCSKVDSKSLASAATPGYLDNNDFEEDDYDDDEEEDLSQPLVKLTVYFPKEKVEKQIDARVGMTVFRAILKHDITLLPNSCNGQLSCRTCHCLVEAPSMHYFSKAKDSEEDLLDAFANCQTNSRLACQMRILQEFKNARIEVVPEIKKEDKM